MDTLLKIIWYAFLAVFVLQIAISHWRILEKAGEKGFKALIPFYNIFLSHHIVGMKHIWFALEMIIWVFETFVITVIDLPLWFKTAFTIFATVCTLVMETVHTNKMGNCFGKGTWFKIGMFFMPYVFQMIIAFGSSEYKKPVE